MDMTVKLQVFEGPLDLLLHLLEKNKVNIYDIPIVEITAQYMEYIAEMKRQDLDVLSEFLVMAATLIDIKSRMLLPSDPNNEEEEEDPRAELVQQLLEYKMYKCMAYELKDRQMDAQRVMFKEPTIPDEVLAYEEPLDIEELVSDVTLAKLNDIFKNIMKKYKVSITDGKNEIQLSKDDLHEFLTNTLSNGFSVLGSNLSFLYQGAVNLLQSLWSLEGNNVRSPL